MDSPAEWRKAKLFSAKEAILERRKKKKKQNRSSKELDLTEGVIFFFTGSSEGSVSPYFAVRKKEITLFYKQQQGFPRKPRRLLILDGTSIQHCPAVLG